MRECKYISGRHAEIKAGSADWHCGFNLASRVTETTSPSGKSTESLQHIICSDLTRMRRLALTSRPNTLRLAVVDPIPRTLCSSVLCEYAALTSTATSLDQRAKFCNWKLELTAVSERLSPNHLVPREPASSDSVPGCDGDDAAYEPDLVGY